MFIRVAYCATKIQCRFISIYRKKLPFLQVPNEQVRFSVMKNKSASSKPVPVATVPSSKLAAMAANMVKSERDIDMDISPDIEDDAFDNDTPNLVDISIVSEMLKNNSQTVEDKENDSGSDRANTEFIRIDKQLSGKSILKGNGDEQCDNDNIALRSCDEEDNSSIAGTSSLKDLSLSCINHSDLSDVNYRLT